MLRIGAFTLDEGEVEKRKAYLQMTPADERRLGELRALLRPHTRVVIDRFYEYLLSHEHTRRILSEPGVVERLKGLQTRYFDELTSGTYDLAYCENRLRVGQTHHRIGLSPEWYLGAYVKYLHIVSDVLSREFGREYERYFQTTVSLTKVIYLDMGIALDAYHFSAQADLATKNEELRRLQEVRRQLTDMIVHDLQNPLAGILAFLQGFRGRAGLTEFETRCLEEALVRCEDLSRMISNVLQVSRAEAGLLQTYIEEVNLSELARRAVAVWRPIAERERRTLEFEAPEAVRLRTDASLVDRMLQNLLRNALRHTPEGTGIRVQVSSGAEVDAGEGGGGSGGGGRVRVEDDGPGIPTDVQPLLFRAYGGAALRDAGVRVDSGLGLAFCRVAAEVLGGSVRVESDGKRGSAFTVSLPSGAGQ
ncbi:MAG: hypothetical protein HYZ53_30080 [Planctomycetes bacterium]|nr:hypothetical protein [Planctomycetota bacterium]